MTQDPKRLFSEHWYRVRDLQPQLSENLQVSGQPGRGQYWYVISLPGRNKRLRINQAAYAVLGRCDGSVSLEKIFRTLLTSDPESVPGQGEIIDLASKLISDGYLFCSDWPQIDDVLGEHNKKLSRLTRQNRNPMAPRFSLGNPNRMLSTLDPLALFIFSRTGLIIWLILLCLGASTLVNNWAGVATYFQQWATTPSMWLISALCFPLIKLFHEAAHGLAVRRWGGSVNDAGIGLLLLFPAPYVDASDANQFAKKSQRAWVSAAGIATELTIAVIAIGIWKILDPGFFRDLTFSCALIAGVSTVAFNANPLVRLDGYYLLTDIIGLPNLAQRSRRFWQNAIIKHLLKIAVPTLDLSTGERPWLLVYQPLSWLYRCSVLIWFAWWVASYSSALGLLTGTAALVWLLVVPMVTLVKTPQKIGASLAEISGAWFRLCMAGLALAVFALIPIPDRTLVIGVVWTGDDATVRARHDGFLSELTIPVNQSVKPGETVMMINDPVINARVSALQSQLPGLQSAWLANLNTDAVKARHTQEKIRLANQEIAFVIESQSRLDVISPASGRLRLPEPWSDMTGKFVREGEILGYIDQISRPVIRTVLDQNQAARIKSATGPTNQPVAASIRLSHTRGKVVSAQTMQFVPAPTVSLPSPALASVNGGTVDLNADTRQPLAPARPTYVVDVIADEVFDAAIGARAWVRMDFGYSPAVAQLARWLRQLINSETAAQIT
ncbi:MAG: hypothetical protein WBD13_12650 [Burkholderiaceae bacterium]